MTDLAPLTARLHENLDLVPEEIPGVAAALASPDVPAGEKEALLAALARKGETADEVAAFAEAFRGLSIDPGLSAWAERGIDVCGTGGDRAETFNISTLTLFILASGGVPVLKHGNRSISSKCGGADLLEALGVQIDASPERLRQSLEHLGFAFLFAPRFHPAFKEIAPVRRALAAKGQRTVFNLLGPLINPARPAHQLLGVFAADWVDPLAGALDRLGLTAGLVVHGALPGGRGVDELTTATDNRAAGFGRLRGTVANWPRGQFGLPPAELADLAGGDAQANLLLLDRLLDGQASRALIDTVALNAAAGFYIVGKAATIEEGLALARELLLGGAVRAKLAATREFYRS